MNLPDGSQEQLKTNSIISAVGLFATANLLPDIKGIKDFKGHMFHTTEWDHSVDYKNKNIAVIGNGSSGAQLMPGLAKEAKRLAAYVRTPQWIAPYDGYRAQVPEHLNWIMTAVPNYANWFGYSNFMRGMQLPPLQVADPEWQRQGGLINKRNDGMREGLTKFIESKVGKDNPILKNLIPKGAPLVRRLVVDNGFYDALMQDNVELVTENIDTFTEKGIKTVDGKTREFDLIVLGCGFRPTDYFYPVKYEGRNGVTLDKTWAKDGARSYLGITIPGYPNLFSLYGPNHQPRGGPSIHSWSEIWGRYAISSIVWMLENDKKSVEVKQDVYDEYQKELDAGIAKLIWEMEGKGYFVNEHGRQAVNMPWTADQYHPRVLRPNFEEYNVS
jgi:4-hydroxyacetophenone monooxygenase